VALDKLIEKKRGEFIAQGLKHQISLEYNACSTGGQSSKSGGGGGGQGSKGVGDYSFHFPPHGWKPKGRLKTHLHEHDVRQQLSFMLYTAYKPFFNIKTFLIYTRITFFTQ